MRVGFEYRLDEAVLSARNTHKNLSFRTVYQKCYFFSGIEHNKTFWVLITVGRVCVGCPMSEVSSDIHRNVYSLYLCMRTCFQEYDFSFYCSSNVTNI